MYNNDRTVEGEGSWSGRDTRILFLDLGGGHHSVHSRTVHYVVQRSFISFYLKHFWKNKTVRKWRAKRGMQAALETFKEGAEIETCGSKKESFNCLLFGLVWSLMKVPKAGTFKCLDLNPQEKCILYCDLECTYTGFY